ncbi:bifunctional phosphoribosyl-AMP cyclohydrolase/phosphoribosyl-ATP diphosphatase HisIE [Taibaiella koreensis]|uniref:bifunctional phosphoribosyl-AMP cyclohydrolase/phosphoribosyl-ATP diphosphatase HisIE n=1 Tax=Taibaiella koreensis TaxID=1268548 RepID=UPI000E59CA65|nr:bifunctional phosphoribosyl-AMP cyclohydrolase/phosphoribosyl-ATP diphosphatase HisIE [Taibaiella koreensis]
MTIDFDKAGGLVPAIIQHYYTLEVLMLGYMNASALEQTRREGKITFYSRSRQELWTKGATSGNEMRVVDICKDCDNDALLIRVEPLGPACHTGARSCFGTESARGFLYQLEATISSRIAGDDPASYTGNLYRQGINKMAQKVGEEAVELVIEAKDDNGERFCNEAADLLFHFLLLLQAKGQKLERIEEVLQQRSTKSGRE